MWMEDRLSFIKFGLVEFLLLSLFQVILLHMVLVLLVDRNVEDVDFIMDLVVNILLLFLKGLLVEFCVDVAFLQFIFQYCVLFSNFIDYLQQFFYFEGFDLLCLRILEGVEFLFESIDLVLLFINNSIFHLYYV